jgi:hypothetical protein
VQQDWQILSRHRRGLRGRVRPLDFSFKELEALFMQYAFQRSIRIGLLALLTSAVFGSGAVLAQSGSAGGSIGNDEKSLSGSRATPRTVETAKPARRSKPRPEPEEPRRASRRSGGGGGGGGNFDGAWMVTSVGCGGTTTGAVVVTSGRIIGEGVSGTVSSNGGVRTVGNFNGVAVTSSGRLSSRSGSGSFRRSDGCGGTWTSAKQ